MSTCQECGAPIALSAVLNTVNPYKIKCKQCQKPILLDKLSASLAILFIFVALFFLISQSTTLKNHLVFFALPLALCVEVIYFILIRKSLVKIKSNIQR